MFFMTTQLSNNCTKSIFKVSPNIAELFLGEKEDFCFIHRLSCCMLLKASQKFGHLPILTIRCVVQLVQEI